MVGYRNGETGGILREREVIRHSDGGVSELHAAGHGAAVGGYQAFRWWGIGTAGEPRQLRSRRLSGIPMVGYRNMLDAGTVLLIEVIRHSDGGVSEQ